MVSDQTDSLPAHTLTRLKRERRDLFARVVKKELSAYAAAIEAGFRKKLSKLEQMLRWLPKLTLGECALIIFSL
jgi:hypothetical protein